MGLPILDVMEAIDDLDAGREVDLPRLGRIVERAEPDDERGRVLHARMVLTVRHLKAGRVKAAKAILGRGLVQAVATPAGDEEPVTDQELSEIRNWEIDGHIRRESGRSPGPGEEPSTPVPSMDKAIRNAAGIRPAADEKEEE